MKRSACEDAGVQCPLPCPQPWFSRKLCSRPIVLFFTFEGENNNRFFFEITTDLPRAHVARVPPTPSGEVYRRQVDGMRSRICDMSSTSPAMSRMVSFAGFACVWFIRASLLCLCTLPSVYGIPRGSDYGSSQPFIGKSSYHIFCSSALLCWRAVAFSAWRAPALLNQPIPQPEFWKVNNGLKEHLRIPDELVRTFHPCSCSNAEGHLSKRRP